MRVSLRECAREYVGGGSQETQECHAPALARQLSQSLLRSEGQGPLLGAIGAKEGVALPWVLRTPPPVLARGTRAGRVGQQVQYWGEGDDGLVTGSRLRGQAGQGGARAMTTTHLSISVQPSHHLQYTYLIQPPPCGDLGRVGGAPFPGRCGSAGLGEGRAGVGHRPKRDSTSCPGTSWAGVGTLPRGY